MASYKGIIFDFNGVLLLDLYLHNEVFKDIALEVRDKRISPAMNVTFFNEMLGLDKWFDMGTVVSDGGMLRGKPAPDIYLKAAENIRLNPKDCVVIEDARSGIAAAHAADIGHIIAIGPKSTQQTLRTLEGVDEVIESLTEVDVDTLFA